LSETLEIVISNWVVTGWWVQVCSNSLHGLMTMFMLLIIILSC